MQDSKVTLTRFPPAIARAINTYAMQGADDISWPHDRCLVGLLARRLGLTEVAQPFPQRPGIEGAIRG